MADSSIDVSPGTTGSPVPVDTRTEGTNSNHRQVIVLGDPATNAGVAPVDATYGLAADIKRIGAGETHVGQVGAASKTILVTPTVSASPDYSIDDILGGKITLDAMTRITDGTGVINFVGITCDVDIPVGVYFDVVFFSTNPSNSTFTDNSAVAVNVADLHFICGTAQLNTRLDFGTPAMMVEAAPKGIPFKAVSGTDDLYCIIIVRGAATLNLAGTSDINLILGVMQD